MHMSRARVTMADVARKAACDPSTVSLALREHSSIPLSTRHRIQAIANELGYRRNAAFSVLAQQRWAKEPVDTQAVIALLLGPGHGKEDRHRQRTHKALTAAAAAVGYRIDTFQLEDPSAVERVLMNRGVPGIILGESALVEDLPPFGWENFSVLALQSELPQLPFHQVTLNYFNISRIATEQAVAAGFRRIGLVLQTDHFGDRDYPRLGGYLAAMQRLAPEEEPRVLTCCFAESHDKVIEWFQQHRPEVVICSTESPMTYLKMGGYECPKDYRSICLRETDDPSLACVVRSIEDIARAAISLLDSEIKVNRKGYPSHPLRITATPQWRCGVSLTGNRSG